MPDQVEGEHADEDVRAHPGLGVVVDGAQVQVDRLQAAKACFVELEVLVRPDDLGGREPSVWVAEARTT